MARIQIANGMEWTQSLTSILSAAGHEITDQQPELSFIDAGQALNSVGDCPAVVVAPLDRIQQGVERVKAGAFWFVRYPFVADEVTLLVERALEYHTLAQEHEARHQRTEATSTPGNGDNTTAAVARNLAGKPLADIEKQVILSTLEQFRGHRVKTATALGIGVRTLGMKLKRWREEGEPIIGRSHRAMQAS